MGTCVALTVCLWGRGVEWGAEGAAAQPPPVWGDLVVPGGAEGLLASAGVSRSIEQWRAVPAVIEQFYGGLNARIPRSFRLEPDPATRSFDAPLPLGRAFWDTTLGRQYPPGELLAAILSSRAAASLYYGLLSMDTSTLDAVRSDAALASVLRTHAERLPIHARALRVRDGRIDPPGGQALVPLWQDLVGPLDRPPRFIESLLTKDAGTLGYFYSTVDAMPSAARRFLAEPAPGEDSRARFRSLYRAFADGMPAWQGDERRFFPLADSAAEALLTVRVEPDGSLTGPRSLGFWRRALTSVEGPPGRNDRAVDAADLLTLLCLPGGCAAERIHTLAFIQRHVQRMPAASESALIAAARTRLVYPALALELERLRLNDLESYPRAERAANRIDGLPRDLRANALFQFQGAITVLKRLRESGREAGDIQRFLDTLLALPLHRDGYQGGVLRWLAETVLEAIPPADLDEAVIDALAGPAAAGGIVDWEGSRYRVDVHAAETQRLRAGLSRFDGPTLAEAWITMTKGERTAETSAARAITRIVYALALQDLSTPLASNRELPQRHDVLTRVPGESRIPSWMLPTVRAGTSGRHVGGALLALEIGVPEFVSRRLDSTRPRERARISPILADGLLRTAALTSLWHDSSREAAVIVAAAARGAAIARDPHQLERALAAAGIAGPRAGWIRWAAARGSPDPGDVLRLEDHVRLGNLGNAGPLIGAADVPLRGISLQFPAVTWESRGQPPDHFRAAALAVEAPLRVAYELQMRSLPTVMAPGVLAMLATDLAEGSALAHPGDLHGLADSVRRIPSSRFDDYVAAVTARGPLLPVVSGGTPDR